MAPKIDRLDHLVLTVANLTETVAFYETTLGMVAEAFIVADDTTRWALKYGSQKINLHPLQGFEPKVEKPQAGSADLCFLSDTPVIEWVEHLQSCGVEILEGPVARTGAMGAIQSVYVRDPDGNLIEISHPQPNVE